jgi:hypothetical protein
MIEGLTATLTHAILNSFTTEHPMETTFDFADLEAEIYDWQDDMMIPADDDTEAQQHFVAFLNSNYDY